MSTREQWIRLLLDQHEPFLMAWARRFVQDTDQARDLVQETFLRLLQQPRASVESKLPDWLYTVCRNLAIDRIRKEKRMKQQDSTVEIASTCEPPETHVTQHESLRSLHSAISTLSERDQKVVRMKYTDGLSYKAIAEQTNMTVSNVGVILHKAMQHLRSELQGSQL